MSFPSAVKIVEVGPRDGLQNEATSLDVATKVEFIERLAKTGLQVIEAGSFVSPKWVPQMASSEKIFEALQEEKRKGEGKTASTRLTERSGRGRETTNSAAE